MPSSRTIEDSADVLRRLRGMLDDDRRRRARQAGWVRRFVPTSLSALDEALAHGGVPCGAIAEILSAHSGVGSMSLAMRIAVRCAWLWVVDTDAERGSASVSRRVVIVDTFGDFYPPAAWQYGLNPDHLVVLRIRNKKDAFWAVDQSLRCSAVAAVIATLGDVDARGSRRLQLAAESSGCVGLILRSARRADKSFAALRMLVEPIPPPVPPPIPRQVRSNESTRTDKLRVSAPPGTGAGAQGAGAREAGMQGVSARGVYPCRITLLRMREGTPAEPVFVDLQHETGALPVHPIPLDRSVAKTG